MPFVDSVTSRRQRVIVVEANPSIGVKLADRLAVRGYHAVLTRSLDEVEDDLPQIRPDAVLLTFDGCDGDREDALRRLRTVCPKAPIVDLTQGEIVGGMPCVTWDASTAEAAHGTRGVSVGDPNGLLMMVRDELRTKNQ